MSGTKSWGMSRTKVFDSLRASDVPLSAPAIADRCGIHSNTARFHLERLVESGEARRSTTKGAGPGRPTMMYAVPQPAPDEGREYRMLAQILAGSVVAGAADPSDQARQAGVASGARFARSQTETPSASPAEAKTELVGMLETTGFAPELVAGDTTEQIDLCRCPFAAVVEEHGDVVCSVHLGLMQGMLDTLDAGVHVPRLDPDLASGRCVAHLAQE